MCVLRYDRSVSLGALFTEYMPQGRLASKGTPKQSTPTAYTRPMPAYTWNQVAVACLDGNNELIPSSLRVHDGEWVGTSFITGAGFPSTRQQSNTFGYANGYETLFWSSASDWRELNIIDTGNTLPTNTANHGWSVWKTPGATDGECANARIDSSNQLVLMVREPREGTAVGARRCSGVFFRVPHANPALQTFACGWAMCAPTAGTPSRAPARPATSPSRPPRRRSGSRCKRGRLRSQGLRACTPTRSRWEPRVVSWT